MSHNPAIEVEQPDETSHSLAQSLYTDGLHSIFKFLALRDLPHVVASCRSWCAAASKERSHGVEVKVRLADMGFLTSGLRHHVLGYALPGYFDVLPLANIALLRSLPMLTSLSATLDEREWVNALSGMEPALFAACWPSKLRSVSLRFNDRGPDALQGEDLASAQTCFEVVASLPSLTHLALDMGSMTSAFDLRPLQRLKHLTRLTLDGMVIESEQIQSIKGITSLTYLGARRGDWPAEQLHELAASSGGDGDDSCALPHLAEINLFACKFTVAHMSAMLKFPPLTCLAPYTMRCECLVSLERLPHLVSLRLCLVKTLQNGWTTSVADLADTQTAITKHLPCLGKLTTLELDCCTLNGDTLTSLVECVPGLTHLTLSYCRVSFSAGDLARLRSLRDFKCLTLSHTGVGPQHLLDLEHVTSLRHLIVWSPSAPWLQKATIMLDMLQQRLKHVTNMQIC